MRLVPEVRIRKLPPRRGHLIGLPGIDIDQVLKRRVKSLRDGSFRNRDLVVIHHSPSSRYDTDSHS